MRAGPDAAAALARHLAAGPLVPGPRVDELAARLARLEHCLAELSARRVTVGLLGGTGVGKSTLLNAIAGEPISRAGDRRPTTDRAVPYRHREVPLPGWLPAEVLCDPLPPPHGAARLRGVVLLDLPDVDSRARAHRALVHRLVPRLDLLLVVASVEKYADRALYEELSELPQAPRNLRFVLNAVDRLAPGELAAVTADFRDKLRRLSPFGGAEVLALSALRALGGPGAPGAGQFPELLAALESLAGDEARRAALAANAEVASARAAAAWAEALPEAEVAAWFAALAGVPAELPEPSAAAEALADHLEATAGRWAAERALAASWFPVGPVHFLLRRVRRRPRPPVPLGPGSDLWGAFAEDLLSRPLRLAAGQARAALATSDRLTLALPEAGPPDPADLAARLAGWVDGLARRSRGWAWRLRPHGLPAGLAAGWLAWGWARADEAGATGWGVLGQGLRVAVAGLEPGAVAAAAGGLALYYQ
ncbi:MAG: GTPase, partial [Deferrisomatales bacterium]